MGSKRKATDGDDKADKHDQSEDYATLLIVAGCIGAYLAWRLQAHEPIAPVLLSPHVVPAWWLPVAAGGALVLAAVFGLWFWRHRTRSLALRVTRALIEAGLEGRNPRNPDKPIRPQLRSIRSEGRHVRLMGFRMPVKGSAITIDQIRPHLEQHLDCSIQTWADGGLVWMRLGTRRMPRRVGFDEMAVTTDGKDLPASIGVSREGELVVDLTELPHLLVGGVTGGGKSVLLRGLLTRLVLRCPPERLGLVLADLKGGMEFTLFKGLPHLFCPVISDRDGFLESMDVVGAELERRMKLYGDGEVESLRRWNFEHPDRQMPYVVVVVDELAEVTSKGAGDREEQLQRRRAVHAISQIARLGRAVGIHMILCTQRPDAEIVEGQAKSNMGATLAFRTRDAIQSQILLGPGDVTASQIPAGIPGRGIWKWIDAGIQVQTPLLEVERARELLGGIKRAGPSRPSGSVASAAGEDVQRDEAGRECPDPEATGWRGSSVFGPATFDVTRLAVGRRYEFRLSNGDTVIGVLRALEVPIEDGRDGAQTMLVTSDSQDHHLDRRSVVDVRRTRGET